MLVLPFPFRVLLVPLSTPIYRPFQKNSFAAVSRPVVGPVSSTIPLATSSCYKYGSMEWFFFTAGKPVACCIASAFPHRGGDPNVPARQLVRLRFEDCDQEACGLREDLRCQAEGQTSCHHRLASRFRRQWRKVRAAALLLAASNTNWKGHWRTQAEDFIPLSIQHY
ncbi:hypothetical protein B296_00044030 [Ensete ventricosum]|uniref:Uncharacterized protein n=1 Tax=Ensete ventricosum TaxID=4639 RepID=A0A426X7C6_ENSVE|nr:hypothetical protein B296_00044030 [Ensete ventricosum]